MRAVGVERGVDSDGGWTLIELLVALVLMSLLTVVLTEAVRSARDGFKDLEVRSEAQRTEAVQAHLRQLLGAMQTLRLPGQSTDQPIIDASATSMRFVTGYAPAGQFAGLYLVQLLLRPGVRANSFDLLEVRQVYRPRALGAADTDQPAATTSVLLSGLRSVDFLYFARGSQDRGDTWNAEWHDGVKLPLLVQISLTFPRGDKRTWAPLVVAIPIGQL
jgi:general secretion pathway protein J